MKYFKPSKATSVGLITNYRCTFQCEHCLYGSSPGIKEIISDEKLEALVRQVDQTLGAVPLHIGGGEPMLHFERIRRLLRYLQTTKIFLEYVETNGSPLINNGPEKLKALKSDGLECLLVSISPFHNAFIPLQKIKCILRDVLRIYGRRGLFPWHPGFLPFLERFGPDQTVDTKEYFNKFSKAEIHHQLTSVMYIHPGGRAACFLAEHLPCYPAEALLEKNCMESLASPVHAHLDYDGNYLTGFCGGLRVGKETGFSLETLYRNGICLDDYPLLHILLHEGLKGLYEKGRRQGYAPRKKGYVSSCHLCQHIRVHLYFSGQEDYPELYPDFFYKNLIKDQFS